MAVRIYVAFVSQGKHRTRLYGLLPVVHDYKRYLYRFIAM